MIKVPRPKPLRCVDVLTTTFWKNETICDNIKNHVTEADLGKSKIG